MHYGLRTPDSERDVLVLDSLDVEANRGDGGHDLAELELVEDGGLAGGVEADHQDAHILLAEELAEELAERETHFVARVCFSGVVKDAKDGVSKSREGGAKKDYVTCLKPNNLIYHYLKAEEIRRI